MLTKILGTRSIGDLDSINLDILDVSSLFKLDKWIFFFWFPLKMNWSERLHQRRTKCACAFMAIQRRGKKKQWCLKLALFGQLTRTAKSILLGGGKHSASIQRKTCDPVFLSGSFSRSAWYRECVIGLCSRRASQSRFLLTRKVHWYT